jgi:hypothetical protein
MEALANKMFLMLKKWAVIELLKVCGWVLFSSTVPMESSSMTSRTTITILHLDQQLQQLVWNVMKLAISLSHPLTEWLWQISFVRMFHLYHDSSLLHLDVGTIKMMIMATISSAGSHPGHAEEEEGEQQHLSTIATTMMSKNATLTTSLLPATAASSVPATGPSSLPLPVSGVPAVGKTIHLL